MPAEPDPKIAAFSRAEHRRKAIIYAVLGVFLIAAGAVALYVLIASDADLANENGSRHGAGYQLIAAAGVVVLLGLGSLVAAYRIGRGKVDDVELMTMTIKPPE